MKAKLFPLASGRVDKACSDKMMIPLLSVYLFPITESLILFFRATRVRMLPSCFFIIDTTQSSHSFIASEEWDKLAAHKPRVREATVKFVGMECFAKRCCLAESVACRPKSGSVGLHTTYLLETYGASYPQFE